MSGACSTYEVRGAYRVFVRTAQVKRPFGRPKCTWEVTIKMDLQQMGRGGMDWINLARDRNKYRSFVNRVMNLLVP